MIFGLFLFVYEFKNKYETYVKMYILQIFCRVSRSLDNTEFGHLA